MHERLAAKSSPTLLVLTVYPETKGARGKELRRNSRWLEQGSQRQVPATFLRIVNV